jgi:hypothetical protein
MQIRDIALNPRQQNKWATLPPTEQDLIVKAVTRLILFKGSTNDKLLPSHVKEALSRVNPSYQVHSQAALREAQKLLKSAFGYNIETVRPFGDDRTKNKEAVSSIFAVNDLRSPVLQDILSQHSCSLNDPVLAAYKAFSHIVFVAIWTSPGRSIDMAELLRNVRKVDPRFPESLERESQAQKQSVRSSCGIGELNGLSFTSLVHRMAKEGYVKETKDEVDPQKRHISFGPRFHLEIGLMPLAKSYFMASGVPIDDAVLQELDREKRGYITGNIDEVDEDDEEGGAEEHKG